jgi:uncharacterized ion transporter superfamily protein YfcC
VKDCALGVEVAVAVFVTSGVSGLLKMLFPNVVSVAGGLEIGDVNVRPWTRVCIPATLPRLLALAVNVAPVIADVYTLRASVESSS